MTANVFQHFAYEGIVKSWRGLVTLQDTFGFVESFVDFLLTRGGVVHAVHHSFHSFFLYLVGAQEWNASTSPVSVALRNQAYVSLPSIRLIFMSIKGSSASLFFHGKFQILVQAVALGLQVFDFISLN